MDGMRDVVREFLAESYEGLDQVVAELLELEKSPGSLEIVRSIFRTIHSIKGTSGFLGFRKLESLAHAGESLLSRLRDGELRLTSEMTTTLLEMVDGLREVLGFIDKEEPDAAGDYPELVAVLSQLKESPAIKEDETKEEGRKGSRKGKVSGTGTAAAKTSADDSPEPIVPVDPVYSSAIETSVRVDVAVLDRLMTLVGELVLTRNQVLQISNEYEDAGMAAVSQRLSAITTELQEGIMETRMQPIGSSWTHLPRMVRDMALACGKDIVLELSGQETELDRSVIEASRDPIMHLVRNSVDHGIEPTADRTAASKAPGGRILLRATHEGGMVHIEVSDDGAGMDPNKLRLEALSTGFIATEDLPTVGDQEALRLIFLPGFSTAKQVTTVSGRGVGMDVVKSNIEQIGGVIDLDSTLGAGTRFKLKIPLTLAIIPALIVTCRGERYAIPQANLLELIRLEGERAEKAIENLYGAEVYRLRGELLPLCRLGQALGLGSTGAEAADVISMVVLETGHSQFGLLVDTIEDTAEIVVKPLGAILHGLPGLAGATILGDGKVALILDVPGLARRTRIVSESEDKTLAVEADSAPTRPKRSQSLLLFRSPDDGRMAIALSEVTRLEEFADSAIEWVGGRQVVQYRGRVLPLVGLPQVLTERRAKSRHPVSEPAESDSGTAHVVIHEDPEGRVCGLVVGTILDIVEARFELQRQGARRGVLGSAVIEKRVTELLDVRTMVQAAHASADALDEGPEVMREESA